MIEMKNIGFVEMNNNELQEANGGSVTVAFIAGAVTLFCAGFAGGITVGLNKANKSK